MRPGLSATVPPPLPVNELVRRSWRDLWANRDGLLRIGLPWLLLPLVLEVVASAVGDAGLLVSIAASIVALTGFSAMAMAFHRRIILGEPLVGPMAPLSLRVLRYLLTGVLVSILAAVPGAVLIGILGVLGLTGDGSVLGYLATAVGLVVAFLVFARLQLAFPGIAIGDREVGLLGSWALTRGNGMRLLSGMLLTILPVLAAFVVAQLVVGTLVAMGADRLGNFLMLIVGLVGGWVQAPLVATFLSYAYLFFREVGTAPPRPQTDA